MNIICNEIPEISIVIKLLMIPTIIEEKMKSKNHIDFNHEGILCNLFSECNFSGEFEVYWVVEIFFCLKS